MQSFLNKVVPCVSRGRFPNLGGQPFSQGEAARKLGANLHWVFGAQEQALVSKIKCKFDFF
jgi:hypothetical protein